MFRSLFLASLLLFGNISATCCNALHNFEKNGITYVWEETPDHSTSKQVFLDAFVDCYSQIPLDVLGQPSREAMALWLADGFEEAYSNYQESTHSLWISAKAEGKVVGFLIIDVANYPEEIYLSQLAIDPAYHRKGIASSIIRALFEQFPECAKFVLITRRANEEAKGLYNSLGFVPSPYMHEGYSEDVYTGFEYVHKD
jgi:ribosomal protein S18 acetylase RimI-like enzyme